MIDFELIKTECNCGVTRTTNNTRLYPMYQPREWGFKLRECRVCFAVFRTEGMRQNYDTSNKTRSYIKRKYQYGQKENR